MRYVYLHNNDTTVVVVYTTPNALKMKIKTTKNDGWGGRSRLICCYFGFEIFWNHFLGRTDKRLKYDEILKGIYLRFPRLIKNNKLFCFYPLK